jgi:hypothetical protein
MPRSTTATNIRRPAHLDDIIDLELEKIDGMLEKIEKDRKKKTLK